MLRFSFFLSQTESLIIFNKIKNFLNSDSLFFLSAKTSKNPELQKLTKLIFIELISKLQIENSKNHFLDLLMIYGKLISLSKNQNEFETFLKQSLEILRIILVHKSS